MARSRKHFLRKSKRVAKKTLRHKTRKCKRHCTRRRQRGGELFTEPIFSQAIVPVKTEEGISIFRTANQAKELLDVGQQESYDGDVEQEVLPVQNNNTNTNKKKLNQNLSQNKYNNSPVENAES